MRRKEKEIKNAVQWKEKEEERDYKKVERERD